MSILLYMHDDRVDFEDPTGLVKDEYSAAFARKELAPYIVSEICSLDMIFAVASARDGYYLDRLVLKGGLSVRNHVPLLGHRFSFDADYDANTQSGATFGDVDRIRRDLIDYAARRGCKTSITQTRDNARDYFLELGYSKQIVGEGGDLVEPPKIELCKTCRVFQQPARSPMNTFIDFDLLGIDPPQILHAGLEEQLATKLFIIGASGRQRNQFDAYDAMRIVENNPGVDWGLTREIFEEKVTRHKARFAAYVKECKHKLTSMISNAGKKDQLEGTVFQRDFKFERMVERVASMYDFRR